MAVLERALGVVDQQHWLDRLAEPIQTGLVKAFASGNGGVRQVKNALHGVWLGHPLHPVLTDVPIGAWTAALALDAVGDPKSRGYARAADTAVAVGIAGAAAAAAAGLADWAHTSDRPRRLGLTHGLLNTVALGLYAASLVLRRRGAREAGCAVSALGYGVMMTAAYLGGHLVFRERIGVDHAGERGRPGDFTRALPDRDLPENHLRRVEVEGVRVLLVKRGGAISAIGETCAHQGGPLAEGRLEGDSVRCPWHGSRFALDDGRVLDGPAAFSQPCFETRVRDGYIEVRVATPGAAGGC
jgi:nitrite reductase/ring-hydroxylating ferredoxin subunit/uncharacterized membrane protein